MMVRCPINVRSYVRTRPVRLARENEITMATIENFQLLTVPADATFDNVL
jgi:hypothetical protein